MRCGRRVFGRHRYCVAKNVGALMYQTPSASRSGHEPPVPLARGVGGPPREVPIAMKTTQQQPRPKRIPPAGRTQPNEHSEPPDAAARAPTATTLVATDAPGRSRSTRQQPLPTRAPTAGRTQPDEHAKPPNAAADVAASKTPTPTHGTTTALERPDLIDCQVPTAVYTPSTPPHNLLAPPTPTPPQGDATPAAPFSPSHSETFSPVKARTGIRAGHAADCHLTSRTTPHLTPHPTDLTRPPPHHRKVTTRLVSLMAIALAAMSCSRPTWCLVAPPTTQPAPPSALTPNAPRLPSTVPSSAPPSARPDVSFSDLEKAKPKMQRSASPTHSGASKAARGEGGSSQAHRGTELLTDYSRKKTTGSAPITFTNRFHGFLAESRSPIDNTMRDALAAAIKEVPSGAEKAAAKFTVLVQNTEEHLTIMNLAMTGELIITVAVYKPQSPASRRRWPSTGARSRRARPRTHWSGARWRASPASSRPSQRTSASPTS